MSDTTRVRAIGDSLGVILPKEVTDQLKLKPGDELMVLPDANGFRLRILTPNMKANLDAYRQATEPYTAVLRALADDDSD
ncbi:MAG TPA: AbrB/MazE/SpoVT family DNA-binding domain-containing protein [Guyparkeria sp.]|nr:AbrB/MazE/SpoVT family DNA-binding domain-containing protein [Guyparkeria sp.]